MTDAEFDVLDALYFVTPFLEVVRETGLSEVEVRDTLGGLLNRGWVRCYQGPGKELMPDEVDFPQDFVRYHYLATKAGLLAHNGR
ncbi:MAG TPA: hypothetical protein DCR93_25150 [Cytophagales bacterium]|nr:hypothetical protein [Cytophagales bacterium]HAP62644.1 hypothetical protein [Cytophagales bacterium]